MLKLRKMNLLFKIFENIFKDVSNTQNLFKVLLSLKDHLLKLTFDYILSETESLLQKIFFYEIMHLIIMQVTLITLEAVCFKSEKNSAITEFAKIKVRLKINIF